MGRMIDADNITYESIDSSDTVREEIKSGCGILAVRKEDIDVMPTIEERKTGKWIHRGCGIFSCSECDEKIGTNVYTEAETVRFRFCPNCGATMEGVAE